VSIIELAKLPSVNLALSLADALPVHVLINIFTLLISK
jgi:hypothetical protein